MCTERLEMGPRRAAVFLGSVALVLVAASVAGEIWTFGFCQGRQSALVRLFDVGNEQNIPTLFAVVLMLLSSMLLAMISVAQKCQGGPARMWMGLAGIFAFLAVDEFAVLHERFTRVLRSALHASGLLYFTWVVAYGLFLAVLAVVYSRFLLRMRPDTRRLMLLAGFIFVGGAIGMEMLGGWYYERHQFTLLYAMITTVEESLEMAGLVILIYALMRHIEVAHQGITIQIGACTSDPAWNGLPQPTVRTNESRPGDANSSRDKVAPGILGPAIGSCVDTRVGRP